MLNFNNTLFNTFIAYTAILIFVYLSRPNMFIDNNLNVIHKDIYLYIFATPMLLYLFFTYLKNN